MNQVPFWSKTCGLVDLKTVTNSVFTELVKTEKFVLWLQGDLGAGKTTFTQYLLRHFGLSESIPVLSPTFTYLNEYKIDEKVFLHMDLYRLQIGDEDSLEQIVIQEDFRGKIVEWPERAPSSALIKPTHTLEIFGISEKGRTYAFFRH